LHIETGFRIGVAARAKVWRIEIVRRFVLSHFA
jgi:hypothetical protein